MLHFRLLNLVLIGLKKTATEVLNYARKFIGSDAEEFVHVNTGAGYGAIILKNKRVAEKLFNEIASYTHNTVEFGRKMFFVNIGSCSFAVFNPYKFSF